MIAPGPNPIPALACPGTPGLGLPSTHSNDGYGPQSSPASNRTCPAPSSGMLAQYSGYIKSGCLKHPPMHYSDDPDFDFNFLSFLSF